MSTAAAGEITGLTQSIHYAQHLAEQAETHGPDGNEGYLAHLAAAGVTGAGLVTARQMQNAFADAAAAAAVHAVELDKQTSVQELYDANPDAGDKTYLATTGADPAAAVEQETPMTHEPAAPAAPRGHYHPDQPRAADGKWIKVGDELGYADGENVHATGRVVGAGPVPTTLALIDYPDDGINQKGAFVEVATPKNGYNAATGEEADGRRYCPPQLGPDEAEATAGHLEELAGMVESGYRPPAPTKHTRARQRVEMLLQENRAARRDRIFVGDDDVPLTTGDLLKLLIEADPTMSAPQTRHAVRSHAAVAAGGEDGTLWLDLEPDTAGTWHVVATAVEGTESPDDGDNRQYTARHTPDSARELAAKLRAFARAARRRGSGSSGGNDH
ncbi:hypothetical protein ACQP2Y_46680 (plasmid) [Actinoplanes sp. CA-051413]|uniref:hypothetical protein n=1 Tax=Actinoplanes sp. CA-051413 TaxID=3239899 RepID=UPI003D982974